MSLFITFEGGEGSGKSTQVQRLYHRLCRAGFAVVLVREPGGTPLGERLGRLLKHSRRSEVAIAPVAELFLFNACRAQLVSDVILPALDRGEIVLCDRYSDSTLAYQGYGRGLDLGTVRTVNRLATGRAIPDLTVLLDIPVEEGLARKAGAPDRFEAEDAAFHRRVREGYLELARAEPQRWLVIDAGKDRREIARVIWERVESLLSGRKIAPVKK